MYLEMIFLYEYGYSALNIGNIVFPGQRGGGLAAEAEYEIIQRAPKQAGEAKGEGAFHNQPQERFCNRKMQKNDPAAFLSGNPDAFAGNCFISKNGDYKHEKRGKKMEKGGGAAGRLGNRYILAGGGRKRRKGGKNKFKILIPRRIEKAGIQEKIKRVRVDRDPRLYAKV